MYPACAMSKSIKIGHIDLITEMSEMAEMPWISYASQTPLLTGQGLFVPTHSYSIRKMNTLGGP